MIRNIRKQTKHESLARDCFIIRRYSPVWASIWASICYQSASYSIGFIFGMPRRGIVVRNSKPHWRQEWQLIYRNLVPHVRDKRTNKPYPIKCTQF